jgi:hypothetical protein
VVSFLLRWVRSAEVTKKNAIFGHTEARHLAVKNSILHHENLPIFYPLQKKLLESTRLQGIYNM